MPGPWRISTIYATSPYVISYTYVTIVYATRSTDTRNAPELAGSRAKNNA